MTVQMFAFAVLLVSASAQADQCNTDNPDTFDAVGLLQSKTNIILQADRDKTANEENRTWSSLGEKWRLYTGTTQRRQSGKKNCWDLVELEFFSAYDCGSGKMAVATKNQFASGHWAGAPLSNAFDGQSKTLAGLRSVDGDKGSKEVWVGADGLGEVRCLRINQGTSTANLCRPDTSVAIQRWDRDTWKTVKSVAWSASNDGMNTITLPALPVAFIVAANLQSCKQACAEQSALCDAAAGSQLNTDAKVKEAAEKGGSPCKSMIPHTNGAYQNWDGPWQASGNRCGWASGAYTMTCEKPGSSGLRRICACKAKGKKSEAAGAAAHKAAKQVAADKAVVDASTNLRTDLKELTSTKEDFAKELKTLETHIAQTETAAEAVKSMAKNAAGEMVAAKAAVEKAKKDAEAAKVIKDKEEKVKEEALAAKHKLIADKLLKTAEAHKADADKAIKDLEGHQKLAKDAEIASKKEAANKDAAASTAAQELAKKTQDAANMAKAAAATAKVKASKAKVATDVAAR